MFITEALAGVYSSLMNLINNDYAEPDYISYPDLTSNERAEI